MEEEWQRYYRIAEQAERERNFALAEATWAVAALLSEQCNDGGKRLAYCLDHLGHALFQQKKFVSSRFFLNRSWKLRLQSQEHSLLDRAATLNLIAELSFMEGDLAQAERLCFEVFRVLEAKLGKEHARTQAAERNYLSVKQLHANNSKVGPAAAPLPSQSQSQPLVQAPQTQEPRLSQPSTGPVPQSQPVAQPVPPQPVIQAVSPQPQPAAAAVPPSEQPRQTATPPVAVQTAPNTVSSSSLSSVQRKKPNAESLHEQCEKCGQKMYGDECLRCTGTSIKAVSPYDRLT